MWRLRRAIHPVIGSSENDVQLHATPGTTAEPSSLAIRARALSTFCPSIFNGFEEFISIVFCRAGAGVRLICFMAAASSEAGTTCSPAATAVRLPSGIAYAREITGWLLHHVAGQRGRHHPTKSSAEQLRSFPVWYAVWVSPAPRHQSSVLQMTSLKLVLRLILK